MTVIDSIIHQLANNIQQLDTLEKGWEDTCNTYAQHVVKERYVTYKEAKTKLHTDYESLKEQLQNAVMEAAELV